MGLSRTLTLLVLALQLGPTSALRLGHGATFVRPSARHAVRAACPKAVKEDERAQKP